MQLLLVVAEKDVRFRKFAIFGITSTSWQLKTSSISHFTKAALVDTLNPTYLPTYLHGTGVPRRCVPAGLATGLLPEACLSRHGWTLEGTLIFTVPKDIRPSGGHSGGGGGGGCVFFFWQKQTKLVESQDAYHFSTAAKCLE